MSIDKTAPVSTEHSLNPQTGFAGIHFIKGKEWSSRIAQVLRVSFFWGLVSLLIVYTLYVYVNHFPRVSWLPRYEAWGLTYLNLEHFLFLAIVVLSSRKFEVAGGVTTTLLMWLVMVIHDVGLQPIVADTWLALAFTLLIGISTAWLVGTYVKTKTMEEKIILQLRSAIEKSEWMEARLKETCDVQTKLRYELESVIENRAEFTRTLVHELKTPLTPLLAASEILSQRESNSELKAIAETIKNGATDLNGRVDQLMDLAKGGIGLLRLDVKPCDLAKILEETCHYMSFAFKAKHQVFTFDLPHRTIMVKADAPRIRQVLINLLDNASKFTAKRGKVTVILSEGCDSTKIEIEDTGIGIDPIEQTRVFERYHSAQTSGNGRVGMGLGLSLAKMLVELHGGHIWCRSGAIRGSVFGFSLPSGGAAE